jgi:uncharacterized membrane protein
MEIGLLLHVPAAVIWVGGMFFAYMVLRPAAGALEPAVRLPLWRRSFARFFPWVWACAIVLLISGFGMVFHHFGGFRSAGLHIHIMAATGLLMVALYLHLFFAPWRRFRTAVDAGNLPEGGRQLNQIRRIVAINLILGLITVVIGSTGRYW